MVNNRVWGKYTSKEVDELIEKDPVVILPVGSYEQHGPHLTLDTDSDIAFQIGKAAIEKAKIPCSVLPVIYTGISEHHMNYPGSLTLKPATLRCLIEDIINSLYRHGVRKIVVLNAHGGNGSILSSIVDSIGSSLDGTYVYLSYWALVSDIIYEITKVEPGYADHAGESETALKLYLSKEDVREDLIVKGEAKGNEYWKPRTMANKVGMFKSFDSFTKNGVIGDPTKSTVEMGKEAFRLIIKEVIRLLEAIYKDEL